MIKKHVYFIAPHFTQWHLVFEWIGPTMRRMEQDAEFEDGKLTRDARSAHDENNKGHHCDDPDGSFDAVSGKQPLLRTTTTARIHCSPLS
jgi:hypothetical protein